MKESLKELNQVRINHGLKPYKITKRSCLNCNTVFDSWGAQNRICDKCKSSNAEVLADTYSFDPETNFQYDLTISQMLDMVRHKGLELEWNKNYKKGE